MFQCPKCDKTYQRKAHLRRHEVTHTGRAASECPFCKKSFLKPEVARRHSKACAIKYNQQPTPAAKPGRKRQACDQCFSTKRACDKDSPCSRCQSLGQKCTFESEQLPSQISPSSTNISLSTAQSAESESEDGSQFSFLRHFTDPYVERDRLAIGTTAECSVRRNLESLYSHIEDALVPSDTAATGFGDFLATDMFFRPALNMDDYIPTDFLTCGPTKLSEQLNELMMELTETSNSMGTDDTGTQQPLMDATQLAPLFTVSNLAIFISVFFHSLHWHLPVVHFPTFDPGNVSNPLLLAIFLAGATYSNSLDEAALLPRLLDVAEEHIFRKITALSTHLAPQTRELTRQRTTIQLLQAALIIEMLQFGQEQVETRRRIRIIRHPSLVSLMRCLGILHIKRSVTSDVCNDDEQWNGMVAEEVCIRLACWTFLADGFLTVCFKNRPTISIFEMDCSFPWRTELWEAEDASAFSRIATAHGAEIPLPPVREAVRLLLDNPDAVPLPSSLSLSAEHLLIMIYALNSLAFLARTDFFGSVPLKKIRCAASNWKQIWNAVYQDPKNEKALVLGYPKHAEELWLLLTATLDIVSQSSTNLPYLDNAATDDLGKLNEFIQWCCQDAKKQSLNMD
ncbi:hypothetical protein BDV25DRAFT_105056 [Aspergillus avenaceus]|uniref:Fungal-specific transcription factor domain-containing protein n=1 Tax=Aspergillus avenaceus TaxID=36643 RepID=A0A5N6TWT9_ASPAV|nr:hypothetical protein BDV25DRAFT_105056 [Aspergillus avenaceus]